MQREAKKQEGSVPPTRITDLRASLRNSKSRFEPGTPKPPKAKKAPKRETEDERAAKAERQAMAQHTTSLLKGGNSRKPYLRPGERAERKGTAGGLFLQFVLVFAMVGGVAYAMDPTIVPAEWQAQAHALIKQYMPAK